LIDTRLAISTAAASDTAELINSVQEIIEQLELTDDLDSGTRRYLLEVANHLLQVLQRFDVFGGEGVLEVQSKFLLVLTTFHADTFANGAASPARSFGERLWNVMEKAVILSGVPANAFAISQIVSLALDRGHG
jgi:hypothetical protein